MRTAEWVALGYSWYLVIVAWRARGSVTGRAPVVVGSCGLLILIASIASLPATPAARVCRDWLPGVYLIVCYWLSGLFSSRPDASLEARLIQRDRRLFAWLRIDRSVAAAPRPLLEALELAYLGLYVVVPGGVAALYLAGRRDLTDAYWTAALLATCISCSTLPWVTIRPPRALGEESAIDRRRVVLRRFNVFLLRRASIQVDTIPSCHTAAALAVAVALSWWIAPVGILFVALALLIPIGSVVGRYHYSVDAALGILVGLLGAACGIAASR